MPNRSVTVRLRVPMRTRARRKKLGGTGLAVSRKSRIQQIEGGFLPALIPLLAAVIGAVPGIASVALQASRRHE